MNETWFSQTCEVKNISRIPVRPTGGHPAEYRDLVKRLTVNRYLLNVESTRTATVRLPVGCKFVVRVNAKGYQVINHSKPTA
jgi:hypothetical protein